MTSRLLNKLAIILRVVLLLSAAVFLILVFSAPDTEWLDSKSYDDWKDLINNAPNIERLQNIASNILSFSWITHGTALWLCRLAMVAFLIIMVGAVIGLFQIRKIKKQLDPLRGAAPEPTAK